MKATPSKRLLILLCQLAILMFWAGGFVSAQSTVKGVVVNEKSNPVADASVTLMQPKDSMVVAFNFTNQKGEFAIIYNGKETNLLLGVSGFNIRQHIQKVAISNQLINISVKEEAIELKEFSLKAPKIWGVGDTINYSVAAVRDSTDVVIGDVLKKLPGITVKESGQIKYKGKPISKFYIENLDMLQGRYGIATNNISAADVATVQVFENHQPIKALQDVAFTTDAAINLILRPDARGIFSAMAELGGGSNKSVLWNNTLTGMFFSKTRQHLTSLKSNNTGTNPEQEFQSFYNRFAIPPASLSHLIKPAPPPISQNRYLFNQAFGATINNLFKIGNDAELTININGFNDADDRVGFSRTSYLIPDATPITVSEDMNSNTTRLNFEGGLGYKKNTKQSYLNTLFQAAFSIDESKGNIKNGSQLSQTDKDEPLRLTNTIHWVKRSNSEKQPGIEFNSRTYYLRSPYTLDVAPGVFAQEFNNNEPFQAVRQRVNFNSFQTGNSMMFLTQIQWKSILVNPVALFSLEHQTLNTNLLTSVQDNIFIPLENATTQNEMSWMRLQTGLSLNFTYRKRDLNIMLFTPLQYQHISLANQLQGNGNENKNRIVFLPGLNFNYDLSARWKVGGHLYLYNHSPNLRSLYSGLVLRNYRTLAHYESKLAETHGQQGSIRVSYRNVLQSLFASIEVKYNRYRNEVMYAQQFEGTKLKIYSVEMTNTGDYLSVVGRVGKGFDWKKLSLNAECSWGSGSTPQLRQGNLVTFRNRGLNANITLTMEPAHGLVFANKTSASTMAMTTDGNQEAEPLFNFINATTTSYVFANGLMASVGFEYYHSKDQNRRQDFLLLDAQMAYTYKRIRFSLDFKNLLNAQNYVYSYYGNLNSYYSEYRIRPASVLLSARFKLF